jgi:hypothetical protein
MAIKFLVSEGTDFMDKSIVGNSVLGISTFGISSFSVCENASKGKEKLAKKVSFFIFNFFKTS